MRDWAVWAKTNHDHMLSLVRYVSWKEAVALVKIRPDFICINNNGDILSQS